MAKTYELWRGPSEITDEPVVALASGIGLRSLNPKTGDAVQVYFLKAEEGPADAVRARDTRATCGDCVHAPHRDGTCYVNVAFGAENLWRSWNALAVPTLDRGEWGTRLGGRFVRIGAYGDPACAPDEVVLAMAAASGGHTSYTQQWRERPALRRVCMASVTSNEEREEAEALGWRAFQVVPTGPGMVHLVDLPREVAVCAASIEKGGKTDCASCRACGGLSSRARASVAVGAHGMRATRFAAIRGLGPRPDAPGSGRQGRPVPPGGAWGFLP